MKEFSIYGDVSVGTYHMTITRDFPLNGSSRIKTEVLRTRNLKNINTTLAENKVTEPRSMLRGNTFIGIQALSLY